MPVIELSLARLEGMVGISQRRILETLPFLGLDIESESDDMVRAEYSPNRPDYSTDYGVAAGLEGLLGVRTGTIGMEVRRSGRRIRVEDAVGRIRPYVTGICATGGRRDSSLVRQLISMQEDLHFGVGRRRRRAAIGIHDMDAIRFPLLYTAIPRSKRFVPLNGADEMSAADILSKTDTGREYGHLVGRGPVPAILDADDNVVSMPPVINSARTALGDGTSNIFVDVTGVHLDDVEDALAVISLVLQRAGFGLESVAISGLSNRTPRLEARTAKLDVALANSALGMDLEPREIASCLERARIGATVRKDTIVCRVPRYRFDILGPMDLVEEAALGYGVQNIAPAAHPASGNMDRGAARVDNMMTGLGFSEVLNSCLTDPSILPAGADRIAVSNPKSREHAVLRDSLLPGLLHALGRNVHQPYPQDLFETGPVFVRGSPILEETRLAAVSAHNSANFSEIKSALTSALSTGFGIDISTPPEQHPLLAEGMSAGVVHRSSHLGMLGMISGPVLSRFKVRVPVACFEVRLAGLIFD